MGADAPASAPPASSAGQRTPSPHPGPDPLIGRVIHDRYRIVAMIARGGMGKVYRAEQAPLGREVALKVLHPNYSGDSDPEFHKRFFLEASTTAKLTHPNTVSIFDYGRTVDDVYYIAMELLEGKTLHRALRESGPMPAERALHIARQICRSLREAHGLGLIHRDLKPANVFLVKHGDESDFVKVLDFGLVKNLEDKGEDLTQTGLFMGSPKYMSPEQIRGEHIDGRADIYALGVILYEMLTGKVPFDRPNSVNILMAHVHEPPPPLREMSPNAQVSPLLEQIVMKTMAKRTEDRFASMEELLLALKQVGAEAGWMLSQTRELSGEHMSPLVTGGYPAITLRGDPSEATASRLEPAPALATRGLEGATALASTGSLEEHEPAPARKTPIVIAALSLLVLLAVGIAALSGRSDGATQAAVPPSAELAGAGPGAPAGGGASTGASPLVPPEPEIARTRVSLRSRPRGALVRVEGADGAEREYGPTPAEIEWTAADAARGREVTFVFELQGHRDFSVTRTITGPTLEVSAELEALAASRPFRPRPARRPSGPENPEGPVGPVKGYKLDPY